MTSDRPTAAQTKQELRAEALERRDALEIDDRLEWDQAITERVLALPMFASIHGPHPEEPRSGLSKDDPVPSEASFETRSAIAPQDEGSRIALMGPVSAYWPMRSEADPRPILEALHGKGMALCLPAIVDRAMLFRRWAPWQPIVPGGFGTLVPEPQHPQVKPTILIVPLAAFDRRGYRIGYGKGYYDRALSELGTVTAIGIGYGAQEIPAVPDEPHDQRLDWIVTETETIRCG